MTKPVYDIDIYTDAGYSNKSGIGTYAFCIKSEKLLVMKSGIFKQMPQHSSEAEAWCIFNALECAVQHAKFKISKITVHTDSMVCKMSLSKKSFKKDEEGKFGHIISLILMNFKKSRNITFPIEFKHIKGHQKNPDTEAAMANIWCDKAVNKAKNKGVSVNFYAKK